MRFASIFCALLALACVQCGDSSSSGKQEPRDDCGASEVSWSEPRGACRAVTAAQPSEGAAHVSACAAVSYCSNPPSSGPHYGVFPAFGVYASALPRGYWVHALEHGGIVFAYNCEDGCAEDVTAAAAFIAGLAPEPLCVATNAPTPRIILTPDPELDSRWAASSWGHVLRADCFDEEAFGSFARDHVGQAPENICGGTAGLEARCR
jgi:hypothetical protein